MTHDTLRTVLLLTTATLLAACAVGPDYQRPDAPMSQAFKEQTPSGDGLWRQARPQDDAPRGKWWSIYQDDVLDALESKVLVSNQNLKEYEAAYRQAVAVADQARASFFPSLSLDAATDRAQSAASSSSRSRVSNSASMSVSASWEIDLWGRIRRQVEADEASIEASDADLANARLSAQASLATDYFELRSADALQRLLEATVAAYQRALDITRNQYASGVATKSDVLQAQTQLASTQAQLIAVDQTRVQLEHAIAVLVGRPPAEFSISAVDVMPEAPSVPVRVPSSLLERRPDIAAAERRAAAANADIGVAVAAYFPTLSLSGSEGYSGSGFGNLVRASNNVWSVGPQMAMTLFDAGATGAKVDQARAAYDQTVATYRQTVLTGLQQAEDSLVSLRVLARKAQAQDAAVTSAVEAERLMLNQYSAGTVAYTSVITAQTTALSARQSALTIAQDRLTSSVSLVQALGGDWRAPTATTGTEPGN